MVGEWRDVLTMARGVRFLTTLKLLYSIFRALSTVCGDLPRLLRGFSEGKTFSRKYANIVDICLILSYKYVTMLA